MNAIYLEELKGLVEELKSAVPSSQQRAYTNTVTGTI